MNLPALIASIPVADLGGKYAQHVALVIAARFLDDDGYFNAHHYDVRMATGLSRSTVQRAFAELRQRGFLVENEYKQLRFDKKLRRVVARPKMDWSAFRPNDLPLVPMTP